MAHRLEQVLDLANLVARQCGLAQPMGWVLHMAQAARRAG